MDCPERNLLLYMYLNWMRTKMFIVMDREFDNN